MISEFGDERIAQKFFPILFSRYSFKITVFAQLTEGLKELIQ